MLVAVGGCLWLLEVVVVVFGGGGGWSLLEVVVAVGGGCCWLLLLLLTNNYQTCYTKRETYSREAVGSSRPRWRRRFAAHAVTPSYSSSSLALLVEEVIPLTPFYTQRDQFGTTCSTNRQSRRNKNGSGQNGREEMRTMI